MFFVLFLSLDREAARSWLEDFAPGGISTQEGQNDLT